MRQSDAESSANAVVPNEMGSLKMVGEHVKDLFLYAVISSSIGSTAGCVYGPHTSEECAASRRSLCRCAYRVKGKTGFAPRCEENRQGGEERLGGKKHDDGLRSVRGNKGVDDDEVPCLDGKHGRET